MSSVRRRPRDRKAQIARAAADAFGESGFHAVSMEDIAGRVGISAAALYRHSPSKYHLFRDAVMALGGHLSDCTAFVDDAEDVDPVDLRDQILAALIEATLANRGTGGLYRRQARYLNDDDQVELVDQLKLVNRRLQVPLRQLRPDLSGRDRWTLSSAALSVIGSISDHHTQLGAGQIRALLTSRTADLLDVPLPPENSHARAHERGPVAAGKYEAVLQQSLHLFHDRGYHQTSMEDIAGAVGMTASGIYRYFTGKSDILAAAFRRVADRVSADVSRILAAEPDPVRALSLLVDAYIARSFENPELAQVYHTERTNLPASEKRVLRNIQRATVEAWATLVAAVQPEYDVAEARCVVHAAFALVVDLGRLVGHQDSDDTRARVRSLVTTTLIGQSDTSIDIPDDDGIAVDLSA
ncbi:TetR/AcrR family transcriptional regulator [Mycolicibacterium confluentis]|nr:TetR/AcrR family transcriptional regulator [Mycolicibacterium confluentis]MCV7320294.1 TetR/AcrR family transcriptional regulator [Mycolicibacterium confluentis]ORV34940.1 TetR family transcriptional regulator [Mycolicibacterium confluentis]